MNTNKSLIKRLGNEDITFKALGGVSEVGATSYYINWKGLRILIDAGKRQGYDFLTPEYDEIDKEVDIFIITHVHQDHVGSLMEYYDYFNFKKIITTKENKELLPKVLADSKNVISKEARRNEKSAKLVKLYENVDKMISEISTLDYSTDTIIDSKLNLSLTLIVTSHLLGSCGLYFSDNSYKLFITSDYTESKKLFHPNTYFDPVYDVGIDTIITETTYGSNEEGEEVSQDATLESLELYINSIFEKGGNILIPAFAIGRTQELILALLKLYNLNRIPTNTKIALPFAGKSSKKPYAYEVTKLYFEKYNYILENELDFLKDITFEEFLEKSIHAISYDDVQNFFEMKNTILLMTPGMLGPYKKEESSNYTVSLVGKLALDIIESERHGIIFAGYQASGTIGGLIQGSKLSEVLRVNGRNYERKTPHIYKVTFPGHVSAKGIIKLVDRIKPKNLILTHGEIQSSSTVAKAIRNNNVNIIIPDIEEKIYLMDNGKKQFFSTHYKYYNLIVNLEEQNSEISYNSSEKILGNKKFSDNKVIKSINHISEHKEKLLNQIDIMLFADDKNIEFYKKLAAELTSTTVSSDIIILEKSEDKDLYFGQVLELISEITLEYKEKFALYYVEVDIFTSIPFSMLAQIVNQREYYFDINNNIVRDFNLPVDINKSDVNRLDYSEDKFFVNDVERESKKSKTDFFEVLDRLSYYKKSNRKEYSSVFEKTPNQFPVYEKNLIFMKKDVFSPKCNSLWGQVESIYDVKNGVAVKILNKIAKIYNERIDEIEFTNYYYTYDNHSFYGEKLGLDGNKIMIKLNLENGIQFLTVKLDYLQKMDEAFKELSQRIE